MEPSTSSEAVTREIIQIRKAIRQKCNLLKRNREEIDEYLKEKYKPIIGSLNRLNPQINLTQDHISPRVKKEKISPNNTLDYYNTSVKEVEDTPLASELLETPRSKFSLLPKDNDDVEEDDLSSKEELYKYSPQLVDTPVVPSISNKNKEVIEPKSSLQMAREESQTPDGNETVKQRLKEVGTIASKYIKKLINNDVKDLDTTYGVVYNGKRFTIGDTMVSIKKDVIYVGNDAYNGTPGLFELLFMSNPNLELAKKKDYDMYKKILNETNVHRKDYSPSAPIQHLRYNPKYKKVISKLFQPKKGSGIVDDPNILVDRLRELINSSSENAQKRVEIRRIEKRLKAGGIIA